MTREMVVEENLVDRYLLGQLSEREAMAFEDFYASDPETLDELDITSSLIDSLKEAKANGSLKVETATANNVVSLTSRLKRVVATPAYGMAASFFAMAAVIFAISGNLRGPGASADPSMRGAINIPIVTLAPTRGGDGGMQIDAGDAQHIVFALDLGIAESLLYTAVVETPSGQPVWRAAGLKPDALQSVTLAVPKADLPAGDYRFIVRAEDGQGDSIRFPFAILRD